MRVLIAFLVKAKAKTDLKCDAGSNRKCPRQFFGMKKDCIDEI